MNRLNLASPINERRDVQQDVGNSQNVDFQSEEKIKEVVKVISEMNGLISFFKLKTL